MAEQSAADQQGEKVPLAPLPRDYNAAVDLIERNLAAGRAQQDRLHRRSRRLHLRRARRARRPLRQCASPRSASSPSSASCSACSTRIDFPTAFLGASRPASCRSRSTRCSHGRLRVHAARQPRARAGRLGAAARRRFAPLLGAASRARSTSIVSGDDGAGHPRLADLMARRRRHSPAATTSCDDICFWLYSSGSTGAPKGTVHLHSHLIRTAELYAGPVLGIARTTSSSRRRSCSSPTGSATR